MHFKCDNFIGQWNAENIDFYNFYIGMYNVVKKKERNINDALVITHEEMNILY